MIWSVPQLIGFSTGTYTAVDVIALTTQGCLSLAPEDWAWTAQLSLTNKFTVAKANKLLDFVMPHLVKYLFAVGAGSSLLYMLAGCLRALGCCCSRDNDDDGVSVDKRECSCTRTLRRTLSVLLDLPITCVVCYAATLMLLVAAVPMGSMNSPVDALIRSELPSPIGQAALDLHASTQKYSVTSGYGLFRRMTGVGPTAKLADGESGWGGLPPQNVQVPAIVMEGTVDGKTWHEIPFRYVQGDPSTAPRRVAPLQPRLDWRMWFAALGSYQHDPWLIHLGAKLMANAPEVKMLMDSDRYPFDGETPPIAVRSWLFHWDFTRLDTPWASDIPGTTIVNSSAPGQWWARKQVEEYAPALQLNNPSLGQFLSQFGWKENLLLPKRESPCSYSGAPPPAPTAEQEEISELVLPARLVAYVVSDHPEQFGIGVAASVCAAVVHIRDIAAPLRAAVGWNVAIGGVGSMLPSTVLFVDAHLSALLALLLCSLLLQRLGKAALGSKNAVLEAPPSAAKVKKE
jgi:hypothetical protein